MFPKCFDPIGNSLECLEYQEIILGGRNETATAKSRLSRLSSRLAHLHTTSRDAEKEGEKDKNATPSTPLQISTAAATSDKKDPQLWQAPAERNSFRFAFRNIVAIPVAFLA